MKNDPRVQKTLNEINNSFLKLAKTKDVSKITIKELCEEANISRSTFYDHFEDYPSFLHQLKSYLQNTYLSLSEVYHYDTDTSAMVNNLVNFITGNKNMAFFLFNDKELLQSTVDIMREKTLPVWVNESHLSYMEADFVFTYFINGTAAAINFWMNHQNEMDEETFKTMFEQTVKYGVYNYIYTV